MKKIGSKLLCACLILCLALSAFPLLPQASAANATVEHAYALNELGLFQGTDSGFELDKRPTRIEGMTMFIRLLGGDREATEHSYTHPFGDVPSWGDPYVGYAWKHSLTKGTSADTFGSTSYITLEEYLTFALRALGYDDAQGDFAWNTSVDKAVSIGLLTRAQADEFLDETTTRGTMADISYAALTQAFKDGKQTLTEKLVADGVFTRELAIQKGIWTGETPAPTPTPSVTPTPTPTPSTTPTPTPTPTPSVKPEPSPEPSPEPEPEKTGYLLKDCPPYHAKSVLLYTGDSSSAFYVAGVKYRNGIVGNVIGNCDVLFNLNKEYETLAFFSGPTDDKTYQGRVTVYFDDKLVDEFDVDRATMPTDHSYDVTGVQQLKFSFEGSGNNRAKGVALFDLRISSEGVPLPEPVSTDPEKGDTGYLLKDRPPYLAPSILLYTEKNSDSFTVVGEKHREGMVGNVLGNANAYFNLNGDFTTLSFRAGPTDNKVYEGRVNVYFDDKLVDEFDVDRETMPTDHSYDVTGVRQLRFEFDSSGQNRAKGVALFDMMIE